MKTSHHAFNKMIAAFAAAALTAGTLLPLTAHADGDADRQANAAFYANLDQRAAAPATVAAAPTSMQMKQVGFTKVRRDPVTRRHAAAR